MSPKFNRVVLVIIFSFLFSTLLFAQEAPTSADVMRDRISKAKAYIVVKNYNAAIYELENIKQETKDSTVNRVLSVLLMHSYLEQGDYKKAQSFLKSLHKSKKPNAAMDYFAIAGQVVSGAKTQLERYQSVGLNVSDRNLPIEASADVENMRKTLELVAFQSKELSKNKKFSSNALALWEETSSARASFAKDVYDKKRWNDQMSDARAQIVDNGSVIINAVDTKTEAKNNNSDIKTSKTIALSDLKDKKSVPEPTVSKENVEVGDNIFKLKPVSKTSENKQVATTETKTPKKEKVAPPKAKPEAKTETIADKKEEPKTPKVETSTDKKSDAEKPDKEVIAKKEEKTEKPQRPRISPETSKENKKETPKKVTKVPEKNVAQNDSKKVDSNEPLTVGSLITYATRRVNPVYPRTARTMRLTGVVTVEVMIDEDGEVAKVGKTKGPAMLKRAAKNAIKKWKFKPFKRDGQPVKATGFVNFNFSL